MGMFRNLLIANSLNSAVSGSGSFNNFKTSDTVLLKVTASDDCNITLCGKNLYAMKNDLFSEKTYWTLDEDEQTATLSSSAQWNNFYTYQKNYLAGQEVTYTWFFLDRTLYAANSLYIGATHTSSLTNFTVYSNSISTNIDETFSITDTLISSTNLFARDFISNGSLYDISATIKVQCEIGATQTAWEPYVEKTYSMSAGETIYIESYAGVNNLYSDNEAVLTYEEVVYDNDVSNWTYTITNNVVNITSYDSDAVAVQLPSAFNFGGTSIVFADGTGSTNVFYSNRSNLQYIILNSDLTNIGNYAFYYCESLISIEIPDSVTSIGNHAFRSCTSLTSVTIPNSICSIGTDAFRYCSALVSLIFGSWGTSGGAITLNHRAFQYCTSLQEIYMYVNIVDYVPFTTNDTNHPFRYSGSTSDYTKLVVEDGVSYVGDYIFQYFTNLNEVDIGDSVTEIGKYSFQYCDNLESLAIGDSVTSIDDYAFYYCSNLVNATFGSSLTRVDQYAFARCNIDIIDLPSSLRFLDYCAFAYNDSSEVYINSYISNAASSGTDSYSPFYSAGKSGAKLYFNTSTTSNYSFVSSTFSELHLSDSVRTISSGTFYYKNSFTELYFPSGVTTIGNYAFYCAASFFGLITQIVFGENSNLSSIGTEAFYNCKSLETITLPAEVPPTLGSNAFYNNSLKAIYVPAESVATYKAATNWSDYSSIITAIV